MIRLPDTIKTEQDIAHFFAGVRAGIEICDERKGAQMGGLPGRAPYKVTAAHLISDMRFFEAQAKELVGEKKG